MDLVALPKAELHLHFEGSLKAATATELADRYGLPSSSTGPFRDLSEFVIAYEQARDLIGSLDDLHRTAREVVEGAAAQGVVWTEIHLFPLSYAGRLGPPEDVIEAVLDGLQAGSSEASAAGLIIGINRGLPMPAAEESLRLALSYREAGVVGLGLAGDEARYPAQLFTEVFAQARTAGLPALPHAGEGSGSGSVRACVELLGARRINHGVRAVEDPELVAELARRRICLDVCPTSNLALGVSPSLAEHPLPLLLEAGVPVTINSDCPLFFGTTAVLEYELTRRWLGLDRAALAQLARTSLRFSSCPPERQGTALVSIDQWEAYRAPDWADGTSR